MSGLLELKFRAIRQGADRDGFLLVPVAVLAITTAVLGLVAAVVWASLHRGPWYDELYTWHVTLPQRGLADSLSQSWLPDNHPPLFYALVWLGRQFGGSLELLRLVNLGVLVGALAGGWALLRRLPQYWLTAAAYLLMLCANEWTVNNAAELRSYFLSYAAAAVVIVALVVGWLEGELPHKAQRWTLGAALLVGFNTHILTSIIIGALLVPFLALALLRGRIGLLRAMLVPACAAGAVYLATCAVQLPLWLDNSAKFWVQGGLEAAGLSMQYAIQRTAEADLVVLLGGLLGGLALLYSGWKSRRLPPALEVMVLLGVGIVLACMLVTALHLLRPMVMERYLVALMPALAMVFALGFAEAARLVPARVAALALLLGLFAALWAMQANARESAAQNGWLGGAALAARLQHACPDSPVHIDPPAWNAYVMALPPSDNRRVLWSSYAMMAKRLAFKIEPAQSRRLSARCPTLFWAEHDTGRLWDEAKIVAQLRAKGFAVERVWQYRIDNGWIAADRPITAAQAR